MLAAMLVRMWGGPAVAHAEATPPVDPLRPNIVLIVGEDMGPDLGAYGCKDAITPNIDRLAREGAIFTRAFTHCGVCAPSRSGMITGRYPLCYGGQNMRSVVVKPPRPLRRGASGLAAAPWSSSFGAAAFLNGPAPSRTRQPWTGLSERLAMTSRDCSLAPDFSPRANA
jgi:hypothetical protein